MPTLVLKSCMKQGWDHDTKCEDQDYNPQDRKTRSREKNTGL